MSARFRLAALECPFLKAAVRTIGLDSVPNVRFRPVGGEFIIKQQWVTRTGRGSRASSGNRPIAQFSALILAVSGQVSRLRVLGEHGPDCSNP